MSYKDHWNNMILFSKAPGIGYQWECEAYSSSLGHFCDDFRAIFLFNS